MQGPAVFLAQFISDEAPFNSLEGICQWAASLDFKGIQIPTLDSRFIDLQKAAESKTYADELADKIADHGLVSRLLYIRLTMISLMDLLRKRYVAIQKQDRNGRYSNCIMRQKRLKI